MSIETRIGRVRRLVVAIELPQRRSPEVRKEGVVYRYKPVLAAADGTV